jgi:dienelactone hydrolase
MGITWTDVPTRTGPARYVLEGAGEGLLVLGHGAGGGVEAVDLLAARDVAEAPPRLDAAWVEVLAGLAGQPLVSGGRSAGARVACRTAAQVGADAVLCLAFPLHPPGRPERSRLKELEAVDVPVLVVQGDRDVFGVPPGAALVPGADHSFRVRTGLPAAGPQVEAAVRGWLHTRSPRRRAAGGRRRSRRP